MRRLQTGRDRSPHGRDATIPRVIAIGLGCCAAMLIATEAPASQGPGASHGTASPSLQAAMALLVYGASLGVVIAGLIGAARRRWERAQPRRQ